MNVNDTPEQAAFRQTIRDWIGKNVPPHLKGMRQGIVQGPGLPKETVAPLREALKQEGWLMPSFPKEYGGGGLNTMQMIIFSEEFTRAGVPLTDAGSGANGNICQILFKYGNEEQRKNLLAPTLQGELRWCQGYSEPGSGSDLASLQTKAEKVDGGWKINGQKIWTSGAHHADWIFFLARTDPAAARPQQGISFFVFDVKTPGIEVSPLITIDDHHHFNQTFYDNVVLPDSGLVGEVNQGWTVAKALLIFERLNHIAANPMVLGRGLDNLKATAREMAVNGGVVWNDSALRREVAALEMDIDCLRATRYRAVTRIERGEVPGNETMFLKAFGAELFQRIVEAHQLIAGPAGVNWGAAELFGTELGEIAMHSANIRAATIRGGTSEVQRNVVAKRVLGLPG